MNEAEKAQHIPEDEKEAAPQMKEEITISKEMFEQMQEQLRIMSQAFQKEIAHPAQAVQPAQVAVTADSNAAKVEKPKEVVLEEVDTATLFHQSPWHIGAKVRVGEKYPEVKGGVSWKGRVGTISKILKDPSGVKIVEVAFQEVQVPFARPHPTKPGVTQRGYRLQKATQMFDDSCLEPIYDA
jgi:hypothetical protein